jgi:hypothetical protein
MLKPRATITTMRWILLATLAVIDFYIYDFLFWGLGVLWHLVF